MSEDSVGRPLWFLVPGGIPTPASSKRAPAGAAWLCREGDSEWTPIEAKATDAAASDRPAYRQVSKFR